MSQRKWRISITNKVKGEILRERELNDFWLPVSPLVIPLTGEASSDSPDLAATELSATRN